VPMSGCIKADAGADADRRRLLGSEPGGAARGILVSHETVRQWALKFGQDFANLIRRRLPCVSDNWRLDDVVIKIAGQSAGSGAPAPRERLPVIVEPPDWPLWLGEADGGAASLLHLASANTLRVSRLSIKASRPANNDADLLASLAPG
jgi:hypothetical protein